MRRCISFCCACPSLLLTEKVGGKSRSLFLLFCCIFSKSRTPTCTFHLMIYMFETPAPSGHIPFLLSCHSFDILRQRWPCIFISIAGLDWKLQPLLHSIARCTQFVVASDASVCCAMREDRRQS